MKPIPDTPAKAAKAPEGRSRTRRRGLTLAVALSGLLAMQPGLAQIDTRVVKLVVPYPPGGATDLLARALAAGLASRWHKNIIVDNRGGASGLIGAEAVARSAADGLTLLLADATPIVIAPHLKSTQSGFKPLSDLVPIALVARQTPVLVVSKDIPSRTIGEFIDYAKHNPGLPYASIGTGSSFHIAMEQFQQMAGVSMLHVPYKGTGPLLTDLIGGQVKVAILTLPSVNDFEHDRKLKILGVAGEVPAAGRPDLPVIGKTGVSGFTVPLWFGLFAPAKTPPAVLESLHVKVASVLADPAFRKSTLGPQFLTAGIESREQFGIVLRTDDVRWADLIKRHNLKEE